MAARSITRSGYILSVLLLIISVASIGLSQAQPTKKQRKQAEELFNEGRKSLTQRNYRNAADQFAQSLAIVSANKDAHFFKAAAHNALKEYPQALSELDIALAQGYKPLDVYRMRADVRYETGDFDGALADIREVLKSEPNNSFLILKVADINSAKGNDREALDAYQRAAAQDPRDPNLFLRIAQIQAKLGNPPGQITAAQEAIKRNTLYLGDAYYIVADGYYKDKKFDEAEQAYIRAIDRWKAANEKKDQMFESYRNLGDIYRRLNRFNDAIRISKQALGDYPNNGTLYTDLSWYYSLADRHQDAIEAARAGVQLSENKQLAYTNLCRAYNDSQQYPLAIGACNAALKLVPDDGETLYYLGRALDLTNKTADATRAYDRAVKGLEKFTKENPDYSDGFYLLGNAYFADGQRDKAISAYLEALKLSPRFVKARYNLGIMYALAKNKAAAMEQYNSLLSLDEALAAKLKIEIDKL